MTQDSSKPGFWETRYANKVMPWDAGKVPRALLDFVPALKEGTRVLVPGCGSAYEARYMAEHGLDVLAIDFSPAAVEEAKKHLGRFSSIVQLKDFFEFDFAVPFDVVYERAFLCALPPSMWDRYAARMTQIVKPGGLLAGFFFIAGAPRGPPFGVSKERLDELLAPNFEPMADREVHNSIAVFEGKERWQEWRRR
ncbi:MAG: methyltransferase domain-containing protein, partial [Burkholderiales bacterium]